MPLRVTVDSERSMQERWSSRSNTVVNPITDKVGRAWSAVQYVAVSNHPIKLHLDDKDGEVFDRKIDIIRL
jgi:hypothetical protein